VSLFVGGVSELAKTSINLISNTQGGIMIVKLIHLLVVLAVLASGVATAADRMIYSVTHKGTDFGIVKAEVYALDPTTGKSTLLFSDEGTAISVSGQTLNPEFGLAAGGRLFAQAFERDEKTGKRIYQKQALYELTTDGSHSYRKITPVDHYSPYTGFFVNPDGTEIGCVKWMDGVQHLLILNTETDGMIRKIDLSKTFIDCYASSIGWTPDGNKLYFSLETGDVHVTSEESYALVGCYFMDEGGNNLIRLDSLPAAEGYRSPEMVRFIGFLPSGEYLFAAADRRLDNVNKMRSSVYVVAGLGTDQVEVRDVSFSPEANIPLGISGEMAVSTSGKYIAAHDVLHRSKDNVHHVWLKDIESGEEKSVYSFPCDRNAGPWVRILGWLDD
jgi:hypothetical protein